MHLIKMGKLFLKTILFHSRYLKLYILHGKNKKKCWVGKLVGLLPPPTMNCGSVLTIKIPILSLF